MWTFDENLGRAERQHALTLMGELGLRLTNVSGAADMVIGRLDVQKGTANVHNGQTQFIQHEEDGSRLVLIEALLQGRPFDATGRLESVGNGTGIPSHVGVIVGCSIFATMEPAGEQLIAIQLLNSSTALIDLRRRGPSGG